MESGNLIDTNLAIDCKRKRPPWRLAELNLKEFCTDLCQAEVSSAAGQIVRQIFEGTSDV